MALFNNIEIDKKIIPFIQKGEGVGIVKIDGMGKCSVRLESNQIIIEQYESSQRSTAIPLPDINLLSYDQGNFINEPKMHVGVSGRHFVFAGVDNNDDELQRFYNTILNLKEREQQRNQPNQKPHHSGMPRPNPNVTNPNKNPNINRPPVNNLEPNNQPPRAPQQNTPELNMPVNENPDFPVDQPETEYIEEPVQTQKIDPVEEIRRYYELKEDGIITEEEFDKKKKQLLGI